MQTSRCGLLLKHSGCFISLSELRPLRAPGLVLTFAWGSELWFAGRGGGWLFFDKQYWTGVPVSPNSYRLHCMSPFVSLRLNSRSAIPTDRFTRTAELRREVWSRRCKDNAVDTVSLAKQLLANTQTMIKVCVSLYGDCTAQFTRVSERSKMLLNCCYN